MDTILHKAAAPTTGSAFSVEMDSGKATFQAVLKGTGALTATVIVDVSNDGDNWLPLITFTLAGTTVSSEGAVMDAPWTFVRARLTAITGTSATVSVHMGA